MKYLLVLATISMLFASSAAGVCNVPQPRLVCAEYFASKVVVEATLVRTKNIEDKGEPGYTQAFQYSLRANRVIRGRIDEVFRVYEGNDSGRATFDWKIGQKYLLFLFYSRPEKAWELDGCGNSAPVSSAKAILTEIETIQSHKQAGGVIHGVVSEQALSTPISGVRVEAKGAAGAYAATTNANGEFELKVPAGRYAVRVLADGRSFDRADFSYENARDLRIEPGGCAQIQLAARVNDH